ncbi:ECF transporter S component [Vaginisenegalia massiliensis]|uniref:ECF transporter S component n=1 Tax=Vaginisenegalia massiliensis TaxID=2058294 RepID=UPI000F54B634|nr:ECF transporter S component [Vaginisenegalia massiliensis]
MEKLKNLNQLANKHLSYPHIGVADDLLFTAHNKVLYLTTLALLTGLNFSSRLWLIFLPNFKPVTTILVLVGLIYGPWSASLLALTSILLSNIFLGMGPWTFFQIIGFIAIVWLAWWTMLATKLKDHHLMYTIWVGLLAFPYGIIQSLGDIAVYRIPNPLVYYLQSLLFDGYHALGNVCFFLILSPFLGPLLLKSRYKILQ